MASNRVPAGQAVVMSDPLSVFSRLPGHCVPGGWVKGARYLFFFFFCPSSVSCCRQRMGGLVGSCPGVAGGLIVSKRSVLSRQWRADGSATFSTGFFLFVCFVFSFCHEGCVANQPGIFFFLSAWPVCRATFVGVFVNHTPPCDHSSNQHLALVLRFIPPPADRLAGNQSEKNC